MATYLVLNLFFLAALALVWVIVKPRFSTRRVFMTVAILLIFTAVFDSLLIGLGIIDYNYTKLLGIIIGKAPIEDFFYAIMAGVLIPLAWTIIGSRHERKS